jgi:hypothetical protein
VSRWPIPSLVAPSSLHYHYALRAAPASEALEVRLGGDYHAQAPVVSPLAYDGTTATQVTFKHIAVRVRYVCVIVTS